MAALFKSEGSNNNSSSSELLFQAQTHLYNHTLSYISSMCLKCAIELGIPDIINNHGQPHIPLPQLVSSLRLPPTKTDILRRLMRPLVHFGYFTTTKVVINSQNKEEEEEEDAYGLTSSSKLLFVNNNGNNKIPSMSTIVCLQLDQAFMTPWHSLGNWLRKDEATTLFESAHEMSFWEYTSKNTKFGHLFNEAMADDSELMLKLVIEDVKPVFEGLTSLVDVGGGTGEVCKILNQVFPHLKCSVLELSHVVANLPNAQNLKFIEGDMFQAIPPANAVLLKWILHNWSDEECVTILKKCREAIASNEEGKVVIIDVVINSKKDEHEVNEAKISFDLMMMVLFNGRERSQKEWENLFFKAGFTRYKITPIFGLESLIEVFP